MAPPAAADDSAYRLGHGLDVGPFNFAGYSNVVPNLPTRGPTSLTLDDLSLFVTGHLGRFFNPFPEAELRRLCAGVKRLIVLERALSPGAGGIIGAEVRAALSRMPGPPEVYNYAAGLGGRDMPMDLLSRILDASRKPARDAFSIFDVQPDKLPAEER